MRADSPLDTSLARVFARCAGTADRPGPHRAERISLVRGGAWAAGARADAVVLFDDEECDRRTPPGHLPLTGSLRLLDALLCLPFGSPVHISALSQRHRESLRAAPRGVVAFEDDFVRRLARPPVQVLATVVSLPPWREAFATAALFRPFSRSYILAPAGVDLSTVAWEAQVAGIGVLARDGGGGVADALPAPPPAHPGVLSPARWRFLERVYSAGVVAA